MAEEPQVTGQASEGAVLLTVSFNQEFLLKKEAGEQLSKRLVDTYREILEKDQKNLKTASCVVEIQSETAGSSLVRALLELWKEVVEKNSGQVVCVNYPPDYIDSLTALGLPSLPGFNLARTTTKALQDLAKKQ